MYMSEIPGIATLITSENGVDLLPFRGIENLLQGGKTRSLIYETLMYMNIVPKVESLSGGIARDRGEGSERHRPLRRGDLLEEWVRKHAEIWSCCYLCFHARIVEFVQRDRGHAGLDLRSVYFKPIRYFQCLA